MSKTEIPQSEDDVDDELVRAAFSGRPLTAAAMAFERLLNIAEQDDEYGLRVRADMRRLLRDVTEDLSMVAPHDVLNELRVAARTLEAHDAIDVLDDDDTGIISIPLAALGEDRSKALQGMAEYARRFSDEQLAHGCTFTEGGAVYVVAAPALQQWAAVLDKLSRASGCLPLFAQGHLSALPPHEVQLRLGGLVSDWRARVSDQGHDEPTVDDAHYLIRDALYALGANPGAVDSMFSSVRQARRRALKKKRDDIRAKSQR